MSAGVQTKQAAKEMVPETVNEQQQTGTTERWVSCFNPSIERSRSRSYFRLSWRSRFTDL